MARCERGYLCRVCGEEVEDLRESELYLRYVLGEVDPATLPTAPERHLRCSPTLAQFIVAAEFTPVEVEGPFDKRQLDPRFVREEEERVTAGYRRLLDLFANRPPLDAYLSDDASRQRRPDDPSAPKD